jgi:hypothetical protein
MLSMVRGPIQRPSIYGAPRARAHPAVSASLPEQVFLRLSDCVRISVHRWFQQSNGLPENFWRFDVWLAVRVLGEFGLLFCHDVSGRAWLQRMGRERTGVFQDGSIGNVWIEEIVHWAAFQPRVQDHLVGPH